MEDLIINEHVLIPASELQFTFSRSGGPGGQNVNKVNSKATLTWDLASTQALYPGTVQRLKALAGSRLTESGMLQITSQVHRDQLSNIQACRERLRHMILDAMTPPTVRKPTRPTRGSQRRRIEGKRMQSQKKQGRAGGWE
ncbi:alternative ribosome rescue aminoacyl-tRNA hydrolase ArfB [Pirellulaceae bacterium SH467]